MSELPRKISSGELILSWINDILLPWTKENRLTAGLGIRLERGAGGTLISSERDVWAYRVTKDVGRKVKVAAGVRRLIHVSTNSDAEDTHTVAANTTEHLFCKYVYNVGGSPYWSGPTWDATLPSESVNYRLFHIATVETDADKVTSIVHHHLGDLDEEPHQVPPGLIAMWSGTTIPDGWKLCDGTNSTPDLRGYFIVGYNSGDSDYATPGNWSEGGTSDGTKGGYKYIGGGSGTTDSCVPADICIKHTHSLCISTCTQVLGNGGTSSCVTYVSCVSMLDCNDSTMTWCTPEDITNDAITIPKMDNRPPYYTLAFIMKT